MNQLLSDHFAREAGDYLADLERLLLERPVPDSEQVFRRARGIRGSAGLAGAEGIASVAARIEGAARFLLEGRIPWSEELRERFAASVADLRELVAAGPEEWGDADDARVGRALARWGGFETVAATPPVVVGESDGVHSFVRAELEQATAALDDACNRLRAAPREEAPLRRVLDGVRVLRGVAGSEPLRPVLEVVDGVDELVRTMIVERAPAEGDHFEVLVAARDALASALHGLDRGNGTRAVAEPLARFRELHVRLTAEGVDAADPTVVPISALFFDDAGPHVVSSPAGAAGAPAAADGEPPVPAPDDGEDAVPIESLLLRGERALQAALELRPEIERLTTDAAPAALRAQLDELWDLVEAGRSGGGA